MLNIVCVVLFCYSNRAITVEQSKKAFKQFNSLTEVLVVKKQ